MDAFYRTGVAKALKSLVRQKNVFLVSSISKKTLANWRILPTQCSFIGRCCHIRLQVRRRFEKTVIPCRKSVKFRGNAVIEFKKNLQLNSPTTAIKWSTIHRPIGFFWRKKGYVDDFLGHFIAKICRYFHFLKNRLIFITGQLVDKFHINCAHWFDFITSKRKKIAQLYSMVK